jgi:hypothetical protein
MGLVGTFPLCMAGLSCESLGLTGTYPFCTAPEGSCEFLGMVGTFPDCTFAGLSCETFGLTGTFPACSFSCELLGLTGTFPSCEAVVTCADDQHRDPQTNTCIDNGQSDDDHGKADCESAGGQWDAQTDPKCTPASVVCTNTGGVWSDETCKSPEQAACEARGGSMDGECYIFADICHQGADGTYSVMEMRTTADWDEHVAHGDFAPTAGVCVAPVTDACPDDLNPGIQDPGTTCATAAKSDTPSDSNSTPGNAAAPADTWVDPAVDVDRGNSPLAMGGAAPPQDAEAGGEFIEDVRGAAQAGAAAGPLADDEDAVLAEGDDLPVTGMSLGSTILAALLAVLFGAFAYGEAARAARRSRASAPA